jgi:hypothetical protein
MPEEFEYPRLEYDLETKKLTVREVLEPVPKEVIVHEEVFKDIDGLFFEGEVWIIGPVDYHIYRKALLHIIDVVQITLKEEKIDTGYARVVVITPVIKLKQPVVARWKPGELVSRLIRKLRRKKVYYDVTRFHYEAATKTATLTLLGEPGRVSIREVYAFNLDTSLGPGTIIHSEFATVHPPYKRLLVVERRYGLLDITCTTIP